MFFHGICKTCILQHHKVNIYLIYVNFNMRKIRTIPTNEITVKNIKSYFEHTITKFGTGAKIDAPKEHLGKKVIVIVRET